MDPLACASLPAFPLQLLCRRHPEWDRLPVAVVAEDKPQAILLWVNEEARRAGVLPGQRYAYGLSLARELRAGVVSREEIEVAVAQVAELLRLHSPEVDCSASEHEPGVFWLSGGGMERLYGPPRRWGRAVERALAGAGFAAAVVVGFSRFGTYALARACGEKSGVVALASRAEERQRVERVELARLGLDPALRDALARLGVTTLSGFLRLPAGGVLTRFGAEANRLHALAAGERWDPLQVEKVREAPERRLLFDDPEEDVTRLVFAIKSALDEILARMAADRVALRSLTLELHLYREEETELHTIQPAEPTLDARTLLRLVHLRLESRPPTAGIVELGLAAEEVAATREQLSLFAQKPRRDLRSANEAIARLRAELGDGAVVKAALRDGHLPEARFCWERLEGAAYPQPRDVPMRPLVRRIHKPQRLPAQNQNVRDDGWLLRGLEHGPVANVVGPFVLSGGWWNSELCREYHYAETRGGECLWVFYDRRRRRWFLHGLVQ